MMKQIPIMLSKPWGDGKPNVIRIGKFDIDIAPTICSRDYKGIYRDRATAILVVNDETDIDNNACINIREGVENMDGNVRIRKLTPRECWRLQGFPDEYFDKAKAAGVSDTQLYKQAGNAISVNVAFAIGEKLMEIEKDKEITNEG